MADVFIKRLSEVHVQLICERHILKELENEFKFRPPGYQFVPSYKNKFWDGWIRLLNVETGIIYAGLANQVSLAAKKLGYSVEIDKTLLMIDDSIPPNAGYDLAEDFDCKFPPRDYQNDAVVHALTHRRALMLSPTGSGKSLIIYLLTRHLVENLNKKVLIVVPSISLVSQMRGDFIDYNKGKDFGIYTVVAGESKQSSLPVVISTYQSLLRVSKEYLEQYDAVVIDECLHPETLVTTDKGQKQIQDIVIGDNVLTLNEKTFQNEIKPVVKVHKNISVNEQMFEIETETETLRITGNHKLFTKRGWVRADCLLIDDEIIDNK